ncbi:MAG: DNA primase [Methylotenera sp.]|nr:DNA primase [Methylotenera sp.]
MIPESFIQELLNRVDIVDVIDKNVALKKAGANYSACCPFHNEKSPSFTVSPSKQFYHCFGCGAHGTALGFLMEYQGLSFVESINDLARSVGMVVPQETRDPDKPAAKVVVGLQDALQQAAQYYKEQLKQSDRAIAYLKGRGLSGQIAAKFQVGYAPAGWQNLQSVFPQYDNEALKIAGLVVENDQGKRYDRFRDRIMFPIHDQKGQVIGFGGRIINPEDTPKYYNSPETPLFQKGHELYGLFLARRAIRDVGRVLVVEGYMDVVALAQYGIDYAVAALGTATTPFHISKLMRQTDEIVFCFDGDKAGQTAAWRAAMNALPALTDGLKLSFLFLPKEHDPDSYVREFGREKFEAEIKVAMPLSQYLLMHLSADNPLQSQEDKVRFLNDAEPIMQQILAPRSAMYLRKKVAELAQLSTEEMQSLLKLPNLNKTPSPARPKLTRTTNSLHQRFCLTLMMHPELASSDDLAWLIGDSSNELLLQKTIAICLQNTQAKPVVIMRALEGQIDIALLRELEQALNVLDETLNLAEELAGARQQLQQLYSQKTDSALLIKISEKPLSSLTENERNLLKSFASKPKSK